MPWPAVCGCAALVDDGRAAPAQRGNASYGLTCAPNAVVCALLTGGGRLLCAGLRRRPWIRADAVRAMPSGAAKHGGSGAGDRPSGASPAGWHGCSMPSARRPPPGTPVTDCIRRPDRHPHQTRRRPVDAAIDWVVKAYTDLSVADEQMSAR